jgi:hypothetical protein
MFADQGRRETFDHSSFREKVVTACNSKHPDEDVDWHWDFIQTIWVPEAKIRAAHIYPYSEGQTAMNELFGRDEEEKTEWFESENDMMMSVEGGRENSPGTNDTCAGCIWRRSTSRASRLK